VNETGSTEVASTEVATTDLACRELVDLVTDYIEGALEPSRRSAMDRHLRDCEFCWHYVEQMRATVAATGQLPVESITAATRSKLLTAFEDVLTNPIHPAR
jgi:anti-sigma factor RsiW